MSGIGHNRGPSLEPGQSWRKHCWGKARRELLPTLPIEILRGRVKRARELGLDYTTYASVRAATGRDVIGFLFSSNALRAFETSPEIPAPRCAKLLDLQQCQRIALVRAPLAPDALLAANPALGLRAVDAPDFTTPWAGQRQQILSALRPDRLPADGVLLIGDMALEREWALAGRLAGYLPADRYFPTSP